MPDFSSGSMSWINPTEEYKFDTKSNMVITVMKFDTFAEEYVDTLFG